jgi:hypothetical protein
MNYVIFLDDERLPPVNFGANISSPWILVCRSAEMAIVAIQNMPKNANLAYISFDHDLGEDRKTGMDFAKWLVDADAGYIEGQRANFIPDYFQFYVHSQNPVGAQNIQSYMDNYLKTKK